MRLMVCLTWSMSFICILLRRWGQASSQCARFPAQELSGVAKKGCVIGCRKTLNLHFFQIGVLTSTPRRKIPPHDAIGCRSPATYCSIRKETSKRN